MFGKGMVALNAETYIPGHGDLATKADLQRKLAATTERRNKIAAGETRQIARVNQSCTPRSSCSRRTPGGRSRTTASQRSSATVDVR